MRTHPNKMLQPIRRNEGLSGDPQSQTGDHHFQEVMVRAYGSPGNCHAGPAGVEAMLYLLILIASLAGFSGIASASQNSAKTQILILHPYDQSLPASVQVGNAIRARFSREFGTALDIYTEYLDMSRFGGEQYQQLMGRHIAEKYGSKPIALTIALGAPSLQFALSQRELLGRAMPIVYCCVKSSTIEDLESADNVFGIFGDYDIRPTVQLAVRLQPKARRVLMISGASEVDRAMEQEARRSLEGYASQLSVRYLSGLPKSELLREVSAVPRDTMIVILNYIADRTGEQHIPQEIAREVARAASAPTYAMFDTLIGTGIVGGHMDTFQDVGAQTAELALKVLAGDAPTGDGFGMRTARRDIVDARQLDRWNLPRKNLPAHAEVRFETPGIWQTHRRETAAAFAAFGAVVIALISLLAQMRRRVKAEAYLQESEERLNFAAASGGIGLWQYDIGTAELWASKHCSAIFGLPPGYPLTADVLLRRVHPEDRGIAAASIRAATYGPQAETLLEFRIVRPDGQIRSIQGRGHSTQDANGNPIRVSGVFRDLTAYRAAQREAKDLSRRILSIQDEERKRIAQELHDSTAQHLAAINLNLMALVGARNSVDQRAQIFAEIRRSLAAAMKEMRTFSYLLYPQELAQRGLHEALASYIEGFSQRTGLKVRFRTTENLDDLPEPLQQPLLRIVQESLANVHRHASASRIIIKLQRRADRLHLLIADNGIGLKSALSLNCADGPSLPLGIGIPGMAARARQLGGSLNVRSRSTGTLVHAALPVGDRAPSPVRVIAASAPLENGIARSESIPARRLSARTVSARHTRHAYEQRR
jgi:signal transduction histidine kinase